MKTLSEAKMIGRAKAHQEARQALAAIETVARRCGEHRKTWRWGEGCEDVLVIRTPTKFLKPMPHERLVYLRKFAGQPWERISRDAAIGMLSASIGTESTK